MTRNSILAVSVFLALSSFATAQSAFASKSNPHVNMKALLAACGRTAGCTTWSDGNGQISGCSPKVCFTCSKKGQCGYGIGNPTTGKRPKLGNIQLGNLGVSTTGHGEGPTNPGQNLVTASASIKTINTGGVLLSK